jgi:hypothetical protein
MVNNIRISDVLEKSIPASESSTLDRNRGGSADFVRVCGHAALSSFFEQSFMLMLDPALLQSEPISVGDSRLGPAALRGLAGSE